MKVLIIALDGLEYSLVEKFDFRNLKQVEYGKTRLSGMFSTITTPTIWASFITGEPPEVHGIVGRGMKWENVVLEMLTDLSVKVGLDRIKGKAEIFRTLGFKKTRGDLWYLTPKDKGLKTIFDYAKNPVVVQVPAYNRFIDEELSDLLRRSFESDEARALLEKSLWQDFEKVREEALQLLEQKESSNLFMFYWYQTDWFGHVWIGDVNMMWKVYARCDLLVEELKDAVGKETFVLVVSDHGMYHSGSNVHKWKFGEHTDYAFYSSNISLNLDNPLITDFKDIILDKLKE